MKRILLIAGFLTIMLQAKDFVCTINLPNNYKDEKENLYTYTLTNWKREILMEYKLVEVYIPSGFFTIPEKLRDILILIAHQDDRVSFEIKNVESRELLTFKCEEKK